MLTLIFKRFSRDHYKVLGLKIGASNSDIRKAYLTLAKKHHPDTLTGDSEKFKSVQQAYQQLSDPRIKAEYDRQRGVYQQDSYDGYQQGTSQNWWKHNDNSRPQWNTYRTYSQAGFRGKVYGYQYYDPYERKTERYTYSRYKSDMQRNYRTKRSKQQGEKGQNRTGQGQEKQGSQNQSDYSFLLFPAGILMGVIFFRQ